MEIAASLLGANLLHLERDVRLAEKWGLRIIHFDQMDGHFVPNIAFGPAFVSAIRPITRCILDVHLMLSDPMQYLDAFAAAGADSITIHAEIDADIPEVLNAIHARNCKTCISINPETPPEAIKTFLKYCDMVLVMMVQPGFGGQTIRDDCVAKLPVLKRMIARTGRRIPIEVDGGINRENAERILEAGADILVMGTGLYGEDDPDRIIKEVKEACDAHFNRTRR
ncbi:MAG: ribulose-phosphate 3-epimerase [Clostridia bacterium]|nr:ribulose-phosphate 3-epimerase [Clostridia bacterium]